MNLPKDLVILVKEKYVYSLLADEPNYIENLSQVRIDWIRKYKFYHLAKLSEYVSFHDESCSESLNWAISNGYIDICEWIDDNTFYQFDLNFSMYPQILAAKGGHLEMMKWLESQAMPPNYSAYSVAKIAGHQHILDWLGKNYNFRN